MLACDRCGATPPLCDACAAQTVQWLGGTAKARGYTWGQRVVAQLGADRSR